MGGFVIENVLCETCEGLGQSPDNIINKCPPRDMHVHETTCYTRYDVGYILRLLIKIYD